MKLSRRLWAGLREAAAAAAIVGMVLSPSGAALADFGHDHHHSSDTATPIEHLVVIFQENVSFDHYFATYPYAENTDGTTFSPRDGTPSVNGLGTLVMGEPSGVLLSHNPNANNATNGSSAINPFRLSHDQASTCDQDHNYGAEQASFDLGLMDLFPFYVGVGSSAFCSPSFSYGKGTGLVLGYFDGNTVTALWNYAQHFAMSDNSYSTTFGPSTPGVLNLVAGNTYPVTTATGSSPKIAPNVTGFGTLVGDLDPVGDVCSVGIKIQMGGQMGGKNIGDLLNAKGVSWGSFMGGFNLNLTNPDGSTGCVRQSPATPANGGPTRDYIPHHAFFQYWASTANPTHQRPNVPPSLYGTSADTAANHEYDIEDFFDALNAGNLPAVSFLKAPAAMDGHAGYSDPLLEQQFIVSTINQLEKSPFWKSTAVIILYDDSDGWYDHQMGPIVNSSAIPVLAKASDQLQLGDNFNGVGSGKCGSGTELTDDQGHPIQGRCGYGPRQPLIVVSPWARENFVDHSLTDQSSVLRFIEDNWSTGRIGGGSTDEIAGGLDNLFDFDHHPGFGERRLFLDPGTGAPI